MRQGLPKRSLGNYLLALITAIFVFVSCYLWYKWPEISTNIYRNSFNAATGSVPSEIDATIPNSSNKGKTQKDGIGETSGDLSASDGQTEENSKIITVDKLGVLGDSYGALNSLFSIFAGMIALIAFVSNIGSMNRDVEKKIVEIHHYNATPIDFEIKNRIISNPDLLNLINSTIKNRLSFKKDRISRKIAFTLKAAGKSEAVIISNKLVTEMLDLMEMVAREGHLNPSYKSSDNYKNLEMMLKSEAIKSYLWDTRHDYGYHFLKIVYN